MISVAIFFILLGYGSTQYVSKITPDTAYNSALFPGYLNPYHINTFGKAYDPYARLSPYGVAPVFRKYSPISVAPVLKSSPIVGQVTRPAAILRHAHHSTSDGSYHSAFETENGIATQSSGLVKNLGTEDEAHIKQGSFSYISPDGTPITTNWFADENGFHAEGDHLPQPPVDARIY